MQFMRFSRMELHFRQKATDRCEFCGTCLWSTCTKEVRSDGDGEAWTWRRHFSSKRCLKIRTGVTRELQECIEYMNTAEVDERSRE